MVGVILEKLSSCHLISFGCFIVLLQVTCFLVGGLIAPQPNSAETYLGNLCVDPVRHRQHLSEQKWFFPRAGKSKNNLTCHTINKKEEIWGHAQADQIVFSFQMPLPKDGQELRMSRLFQDLLGVIHFDINFNDKNKNFVGEAAIITMDVRLGYRNEGDEPDDWKELANSVEKRPLKCKLAKGETAYECDVMPLFSLGSVSYDFYLLNIRIPVNESQNINTAIGDLQDIWVTVLHQNGGFTLVFFFLKSVMFVLVSLALFVFRLALHRQGNAALHSQRSTNLLERSITALASVILILDFPVEWLSLIVDWPIWIVISDIRQGLFYGTLLCFWIIFTGEHMMDEVERNRITLYWKHLLSIGFASASLFIFEISERGVQLSNPFYSVWSHPDATRLAMASIIIASLALGFYFIFLSYMIVCLLRQMLGKRKLLPNLPEARRRFYSGVIYRFCVFIVVTLVCAALTVAFYIVSQLDEDSWKWNESRLIEYHSAFITGVFGMWNLYVVCLLVLYAPASALPSMAIGRRAAAADSCGERPFLVDSDAATSSTAMRSGGVTCGEPAIAYSAIRANRDTTPELSEGIAFLKKSNVD